jgi:hypothetical protein
MASFNLIFMGSDAYVNIIYGYCIGKTELPLVTFNVPEGAKTLAETVKVQPNEELPSNAEELRTLLDSLNLPNEDQPSYRIVGGDDEDEDEGVEFDNKIWNLLENQRLYIGKYGSDTDIVYSFGFNLIDLGINFLGKLDIASIDFAEATSILEDLRPLVEKLFHVNLQEQKPLLYVTTGMD